MNGIMEHTEQQFASVELWTSYVFPSVTGIYSVCVIVGKLSSNFTLMKAFSNVPYEVIELDRIGQHDSTTSLLLAGIESGCNTFIVHQHAILDFLDVYVETHDQANFRNPNKYVLFLMEAPASNDLLELIRRRSSLREIVNLLIFQPSYDRSWIDMLTHRFVSEDQDFEWYRVDRYHIGKRSLELGNGLFPDKTFDLMGQAIRIATFNVNPHIFMVEPKAGDPEIRSGDRSYSLNGPNGFLLVEFCKKLSAVTVGDSVHMWGEIHPNRTGNGILGNVVERRADVSVGAISSWFHCYQYLSFSFAFQKGGVTCLVPKPKQLPRWKEITMAFATAVYLVTIATFCFVVAIYMLIVKFSIRGSLEKTIFWNALNVLAIYLFQSTSIVRNRSVSESILSVTVLIFSLNLATIYAGKYACLRTIPMFESAIDSKEDLAKSGIPWMQIYEAWAYDFSTSENPTEVTLRSTFKVHPAAKLHQIANQGVSAFASARMHNGHLMLREWIDANNIHRYQLMKNDLYYVLEVAMSTKTWPLLERFNDLLSRFAEGLLLLVQERQNIYRYNDYYVQIVALNSHIREQNRPKALAVEDVLGSFIILGCGLFCALICFVTEVWILDAQKDRDEKQY